MNSRTNSNYFLSSCSNFEPRKITCNSQPTCRTTVQRVQRLCYSSTHSPITFFMGIWYQTGAKYDLLGFMLWKMRCITNVCLLHCLLPATDTLFTDIYVNVSKFESVRLRIDEDSWVGKLMQEVRNVYSDFAVTNVVWKIREVIIWLWLAPATAHAHNYTMPHAMYTVS